MTWMVFSFSRNHHLQFILAVPSPQCFEAYEPFLPCALDGGVFSTLDLITLLFQFLQKIFVILGLFCKDAVDDSTQAVTVALLGRIKNTLLSLPVGLLFNNRQLVFQTNQITQPLHCQRRKEKIPELFGAIQCCGVEDHMVVDVVPVRVRCHHKGVFALGKAHGQFVAHLVSLLCGDFPRTKGLPNLVGDDVAFLSAPGSKFILPLGKHKFFIHGQGTAFVTADQFALLCLVRVLGVIRAAFQAGRNGFPLVFVQCN